MLHFTKATYKDLRNIGSPGGRMATHCLGIEKKTMEVRFMFVLMKSLLCIYFGILIKVYFLDPVKSFYPDFVHF